MATPRQTVAAQLRTDNPAWTVQDYPAGSPSEVRGVRAVVWRRDLGPGPVAGTLRHDMTMQVYVPGTAGAKAEGALDDALDRALLSLQRLDGVQDVKAARVVLADVFAGWEVTFNVVSPDVYRDQVMTERKA